MTDKEFEKRIDGLVDEINKDEEFSQMKYIYSEDEMVEITNKMLGVIKEAFRLNKIDGRSVTNKFAVNSAKIYFLSEGLYSVKAENKGKKND